MMWRWRSSHWWLTWETAWSHVSADWTLTRIQNQPVQTRKNRHGKKRTEISDAGTKQPNLIKYVVVNLLDQRCNQNVKLCRKQTQTLLHKTKALTQGWKPYFKPQRLWKILTGYTDINNSTAWHGLSHHGITTETSADFLKTFPLTQQPGPHNRRMMTDVDREPGVHVPLRDTSNFNHMVAEHVNKHEWRSNSRGLLPVSDQK